jgi:hypothetical protein
MSDNNPTIETVDAKARIKALRRRVDKARKFPTNTCPASRHLHMMAECLLKGGYPMLQEEPDHCAESILAVLESLWEARTKDGADAARFRFLNHLPVVQAQQYFWNHSSRKQRAEVIDADRIEAEAASLRPLIETNLEGKHG